MTIAGWDEAAPGHDGVCVVRTFVKSLGGARLSVKIWQCAAPRSDDALAAMLAEEEAFAVANAPHQVAARLRRDATTTRMMQ